MKVFIPLSFFLVWLQFGFAQVTSPEFNAGYAGALQERLEDMGASEGIRGLSAAVIVPGQGQWIGTYGAALTNQPVEPDMRFCIASNSKLFTAVLCLKLQDEGLLSLDDSISHWLPPYPHVNPNITIRQLLSHQSGLFDFYNDASSTTLNQYENNPDSLWSPEDIIATIGAPVFQPGQSFYYSNTNFLLAAMCCAAAADTSFGYLLKNRILEPLGLSQTAFPAEGDNVFEQPWAMLYNGNSQALDPDEAIGFNSFIHAAGGIWSTAADMAKWYQSVFISDFLSEEALEQLRRVEPWSSYSLGLRAQNRHGATLRYHAGAWGYRSWVAFDERTGIIVAILGNSRGKSVTGIGEKLLETALGQLPALPLNLTLTELISPVAGNICEPIDSVRLLIKNTGAWSVNSMQYQGRIDNLAPSVFQYTFSPALQSGESRMVTFPLEFAPEGRHHFEANIEITNNPFAGEEYFFDNKKNVEFSLEDSSEVFAFDYQELFANPAGTLPANWISHQPDNVQDWSVGGFLGGESWGWGTLCKNNFEDGNIGAEYLLDLPMLQIQEGLALDLNVQFEYAYALYPGYYTDTLELLVSRDCGINFESIWKKGGDQLSTAPSSTSSFIPGNDDWAYAETLPVNSLMLSEDKNIIPRLRVFNGFGNNIWIRDFRFVYVLGLHPIVTPTFTLSPNPMTNRSDVSFNEPLSNAKIALYNVLGHQVWRKNAFSGSHLSIERGALPAGAYFLSVQEADKKHAPAKLWIVD